VDPRDRAVGGNGIPVAVDPAIAAVDAHDWPGGTRRTRVK
jgi:hypothetical protein